MDADMTEKFPEELRASLFDCMSRSMFDHVTVLDLADKTASVFPREPDGKVTVSDYNDRLDEVISTAPNQARDRILEMMAVPNIVSELTGSRNYSFITVHKENEHDLRYILRLYSYVDDERDKILMCAVDISERNRGVIEKQRVLEENVRSLMNENELLKRAALAENSFIAVLDLNAKNIELRYGSWFASALDGNAPRKLSLKRFAGMVADHLYDDEECERLYNTINGFDIESELNGKNVISMEFCIRNFSGNREKRVYRFEWLDRRLRQVMITGSAKEE